MEQAATELCEYRQLCVVSFWELGMAPESRKITKEQYMNRIAQWKLNRLDDPERPGSWEVNCDLNPELKDPLNAKCLKMKWHKR